MRTAHPPLKGHYAVKHKSNMKEYQIRYGEEILFRCDSWRTANALLDRCPDGSYIYEDIFFDDEPNLNI